MLAKTARPGWQRVSLVGNLFIHLAEYQSKQGKTDEWYSKSSKVIVNKRKVNIEGKQYLEIDECSMMTKDMLALVSALLSKEKPHHGKDDGVLPFGRMSVILFGDFHQFPPVGTLPLLCTIQEPTVSVPT